LVALKREGKLRLFPNIRREPGIGKATSDPDLRHLHESIANQFRLLAEVIETGSSHNPADDPPLAPPIATGNLANTDLPLTLVINDPANQLVNTVEVNNVPFTVSGLALNETATVIFTDVDNHQVSVNVNADGSYSANLSTLDDGTITSTLVETG
jgi:hypothetical protein